MANRTSSRATELQQIRIDIRTVITKIEELQRSVDVDAATTQSFKEAKLDLQQAINNLDDVRASEL